MEGNPIPEILTYDNVFILSEANIFMNAFIKRYV